MEAIETTKTPAIGDEIKVVGLRGKGEKAPKGTIGRVFWLGESSFERYGHVTVTQRVGFETTEGKRYFTAASNVETYKPEAPTKAHTSSFQLNTMDVAF